VRAQTFVRAVVVKGRLRGHLRTQVRNTVCLKQLPARTLGVGIRGSEFEAERDVSARARGWNSEGGCGYALRHDVGVVDAGHDPTEALGGEVQSVPTAARSSRYHEANCKHGVAEYLSRQSTDAHKVGTRSSLRPSSLCSHQKWCTRQRRDHYNHHRNHLHCDGSDFNDRLPPPPSPPPPLHSIPATHPLLHNTFRNVRRIT